MPAAETSPARKKRRGLPIPGTDLMPAKHVYRKLVTKEDPKYVHKICGFLALSSFVYRYLVVFPREGHLGFTGGWFDWATMALHMALSCSALIFKVLKQRLTRKPLIIWEEYRLHAIVFTFKCCSVFLCGYFRPFEGTWAEHFVTNAYLLSHHLVVDWITKTYGPQDDRLTTVRVSPEAQQKMRWWMRPMPYFYGFYQFSASAAVLVPGPHRMMLGYNAFVAIQSSTFLMTLHRKGVISWVSHAIWYSIALVLSWSQIYYVAFPSFSFFAQVCVAYALRCLRFNKYFIWITYCVLNLPGLREALVSALPEAHAYGIPPVASSFSSFKVPEGVQNEQLGYFAVGLMTCYYAATYLPGVDRRGLY